MAVYSIDGTELNAVYDISADSLAFVYNINGTEIAVSAPEYNITNVVRYFQQSVLDTVDELNELSDAWQSFIFVTDTHGSANKQHSQAIVMYLLANSSAKKAFFAGDYCASDWALDQWEAYFDTFLESGFAPYIYPTIGNHERFGGAGSTLVAIYDDYLSTKPLNGTPANYYFYFDNKAKKTRFLFINTSNDIANGVSQTQINWIAQTAQLPGSDWSLVVIGHIDIDPDNTLTGSWKSAKASEVTTAISSCNGKIVGYFCGHEHIDQLRLVKNKFFQLISLCDKFENDNYFDVDNYPVRTSGTATEQVVTVVSFNTTTGDVVTRRIGAGDEYAWNYKTLQEVTA